LDCIDENTLLDFVRGEILPATAGIVGAHLDDCAACRVRVVTAASSSLGAWSSSRFRASQPSQGGEEWPEDPLLPDDDRPTDRSLSNLETERFVRSPEMMLTAGQLLDGRFRLRRLLGQGAMGRIYAAHDERLRVQVALKLVLPALASNKTFLERLHNEIVVARRINHPNVCRVYDLGNSQGLHFISMELLEGETLESRLQREDLSERAVLAVLRQIAAALDAAHRGGVIHRDLKPANIMIDARGHVTVMDFGLARDVSRESTRNPPKGGSVVGTPAYWSPEQARGGRAGPASDIYSLGVIAVRMFTGRRRLLTSGVDPLLAVREPYRGVIARCLEHDPNRRFASADALLLALLAAQRDRRPAWLPYAAGAMGATALVAALLGVRASWPGGSSFASSSISPVPSQPVSSDTAKPSASPRVLVPLVSFDSLPSSPLASGTPDAGPAPSAVASSTRPSPRATGSSHPVPRSAAPVAAPARSRISVFE
jgi:serine/threonine protein kinase